MIRIAISAEAYAAIAETLRFGSVAIEVNEQERAGLPMNIVG